MDEALSAQVKQMISDHFGISTDRLTPETEISSLGIDSLGVIEFLFDLEDKLNIRMAESRAPLVTVGNVITEIERAVAVRDQAGAA